MCDFDDFDAFDHDDHDFCEDCYDEGWEDGWDEGYHSRHHSGHGHPQSSGGCYVATCVYGSYDCPEVWTLRRFRDEVLAQHLLGRAFIHTYYAVSPTIVRLLGHREGFRRFWKKPLDHMVEQLRQQGVEDTPYRDQAW